MKRKLIIISAFALLLGACTKNIEDLNDQTKKPTDVPPSALFANAQKNLFDLLTNPSVNYNIFRLNVQWWTETTYTDESNYDLSSRNIPQAFWDGLYRDVLYNLQDAKGRIPSQDPQFNSPAQKRNELAMADIMQIYTWSVLVNTFGNVPYKQSMNIDKYPSPEYDDAKTVYYDLLTRLDTALAAIDQAEPSFGASDLIYGGDMAKWVKFGNSLKLKMGMVIADSDAPKAKQVVEAAVTAGVFTSEDDNAVLLYKESPPNTNPIWKELVQSGRHDFVMARTFIDTLKAWNDPRLALYATTDASGVSYTGGVVGKGNKFANFSQPVDKIQKPTFEALILDYPEVELLLAEAAARNMSVGGSVISHYDAGVTASILYWGGTAAQASTYLAGSGNYATLPGSYKQKIGIQKWITMYNRGFDAWTDIRRFDYPKLPEPDDPLSGFPVRYTYPAEEQTLNNASYTTAAKDIGGDAVETRLFWDIE